MYRCVSILALLGLLCGCYLPVPTVPLQNPLSRFRVKKPALLPAGTDDFIQDDFIPYIQDDFIQDDFIHVFVFAGFRQLEVEQKISDEVSTSDVSMFNALVLRYEITDSQHIVELAERGFIGSINWKVPEVAYGYHISVDAPPTDGVLESLDEWAKETTEGTSGSAVTVLADSKVLQMIQRMSDIPPVIM